MLVYLHKKIYKEKKKLNTKGKEKGQERINYVQSK